MEFAFRFILSLFSPPEHPEDPTAENANLYPQYGFLRIDRLREEALSERSDLEFEVIILGQADDPQSDVSNRPISIRGMPVVELIYFCLIYFLFQSVPHDAVLLLSAV